MTQLTGSIVLLTGASGGIGQALARQLADKGANLILVARDATILARQAESLRRPGMSVSTYVCDLADLASIQDLGRRVLSHHPEVDVIINNAGIVSGKRFLETKDDEILSTFAVNALAPIRLTREFLPSMLKCGSGHIVTIASAAGLVGVAQLTEYCSSKFAVIGFVESLRSELRQCGATSVRTTTVCPYFVRTSMFKGVRGRFQWLLPMLQPDYVAREVVKAIERDRVSVVLPQFVRSLTLARLLPHRLFEKLIDALGVNHAMSGYESRD